MDPIGSLEFHEAANIFPLDEAHLNDLAEDIKTFGLQVPIETLDGKIIDGRRRYLACQKAEVEPEYKSVKVTDPIAHVISLNKHRRHLTPGQLSMVGARVRKWYDDEAKKRQQEGQERGRKAQKGIKENLPETASAGQARDQAGKAIGVSGKSIDYATKVLNDAIPEVVQAVDEGRMAVSTAAILASEPEEVQRQEATSPKRQRRYESTSSSRQKTDKDQKKEEENGAIKVKGVGIIRANEAINCLTRIPKNDLLRKRGFQLVTDWIRRNS